MEPEVRERFERIEANFERAEKRMERAEKRMAAADRRMERVDKKRELEHQRAMDRMDRFDRQLQATRRLVEAGIKLVAQLTRDTRELKQSQRAFLDSLRNAGNGRKHGNS